MGREGLTLGFEHVDGFGAEVKTKRATLDRISHHDGHVFGIGGHLNEAF